MPGAVGLWPVKSLAPARAPSRGHRRVHPHPGRPLPGRRPSGGRGGGGATYLGHITAQPDHKSVNKVWARSPTGLENRYPGLARDETRVTTPGQPQQRGGATLAGGTPPPRAAQADTSCSGGGGRGWGRGTGDKQGAWGPWPATVPGDKTARSFEQLGVASRDYIQPADAAAWGKTV